MSHVHEKIDFTAEVFVVCNDRVLLRKHDKYGIWLGVGGHIELHEDPNEAALREVKEEVGLVVTLVGNCAPQLTEGEQELIVPAFSNRHRPGGNPTHEHVNMIYFATTDSQNVTPENPTDEWAWFTEQELEATNIPITPKIRHYAQAALRAVRESKQ